MEKLTYRNQALASEKEQLRQDLATLESTVGYGKLTSRQQEIIRVSLFLQARAERFLDDTMKRPWPFHYFFQDTEPVLQNPECQDHIENWYCHAAIASIESGQLSGDTPPDHPDSFFDASYFEVHHEFELVKAIKSFGFPTVVHVNSVSDNLDGEETQYHSFLVLGPDKDKNIVVWDKQGFNYPYRVTTLKEVYLEYEGFIYWGVRKLR